MSPLTSLPYQAYTPEDLLGPLNDVEQHHAPATLFVAGDPQILRLGARVAIVGSRHASAQGLARARKLATRLCARAVVVVSGLAEGIDTAAHQATLAAGGRTCHLGQVFPSHRRHALWHGKHTGTGYHHPCGWWRVRSLVGCTMNTGWKRRRRDSDIIVFVEEERRWLGHNGPRRLSCIKSKSP